MYGWGGAATEKGTENEKENEEETEQEVQTAKDRATIKRDSSSSEVAGLRQGRSP